MLYAYVCTHLMALGWQWMLCQFSLLLIFAFKTKNTNNKKSGLMWTHSRMELETSCIWLVFEGKHMTINSNANCIYSIWMLLMMMLKKLNVKRKCMRFRTFWVWRTRNELNFKTNFSGFFPNDNTFLPYQIAPAIDWTLQ